MTTAVVTTTAAAAAAVAVFTRCMSRHVTSRHVADQVTGWSHILGVARMADMAKALGPDYLGDAQRYTALLATLKTR
jgi:hypothetical protein